MGDQSGVVEWHGFEVIDRDGDKVGKLDEIYLDRETSRPEWAVVNTGLFGRKSSFVPLEKAMREGEMIRVAYPSDQIKDAPSIEPDGGVSQEEEREIFEHYGLGGTASDRSAGSGPGETEEQESGGLRLQRHVREEIRSRKTRGAAPGCATNA